MLSSEKLGVTGISPQKLITFDPFLNHSCIEVNVIAEKACMHKEHNSVIDVTFLHGFNFYLFF